MHAMALLRGMYKTAPLAIVCAILLGTFQISTAQDIGGLTTALVDASGRVEPFAMGMLVWAVTSILYFGGGIAERRADRRLRTDDLNARFHTEARYQAERAALVADIRQMHARDDEFKIRLNSSMGTMINVITRNNEMLIDLEKAQQERETAMRSALKVEGDRADTRYQSIQKQIRADSALDMRSLAEIIGDKIVNGQREFASTFAKEQHKLFAPMFESLKGLIPVAPPPPATGPLTPSPDVQAESAPPPAEPAQPAITDPDDPRAKG